MRILATLLLVLAALSSAQANCVCRCVNGQMEPLCSSSIDLPPICPPTVCPIMAPSIAPIQPPMVPPIGTSSCHQARVCNAFGGCSWQTVCN